MAITSGIVKFLKIFLYSKIRTSFATQKKPGSHFHSHIPSYASWFKSTGNYETIKCSKSGAQCMGGHAAFEFQYFLCAEFC
jgi:hypothetical protein